MNQHVLLFITLLSFPIFWSCSGESSHQVLQKESDSAEVWVSAKKRDSLLLHRADSLYAYPDYEGDAILYGFKNQAGKTVIRPKFELAGNFQGQIAPVIYKGKHGFCDTHGNVITYLKGYQFHIDYNELSGERFLEHYEEGLFRVENTLGKNGYVNELGQLVIPCELDETGYFSEGLASFSRNGKQGFIDTSGKEVIDAQFDRVFPFSEGVAAVYRDEWGGYIDHQGNYIIRPVYRWVYPFSEGLARVSRAEDYTHFFMSIIPETRSSPVLLKMHQTLNMERRLFKSVVRVA